MTDAELVDFLRWALPQLHLRWSGFRKVRRQIRKRLNRRIRELGLRDLAAYRQHLAGQPQEWSVLDGLCHITISRFGRDRDVFEQIGNAVLPGLARARSGATVRCWSAGCASGEEPYTLSLFWHLRVGPAFRSTGLSVLATDVDPVVLERAHIACYAPGSLRDLPPDLLAEGFEPSGAERCLKRRFREGVDFRLQDLRAEMPRGPFDLVLCRNLAFTYFDSGLQRDVLSRLLDRLAPGGWLIIGSHETLPTGPWPLEPSGRAAWRLTGP